MSVHSATADNRNQFTIHITGRVIPHRTSTERFPCYQRIRRQTEEEKKRQSKLNQRGPCFGIVERGGEAGWRDVRVQGARSHP
ncbi:hypothetical protein B0O80DRAFT_122414 [Mortierella sp. GBAus27b]|nr:hypothetical protein B0O80DRAFT_122414 [Mortierella sp. GBAus27b]